MHLPINKRNTVTSAPPPEEQLWGSFLQDRLWNMLASVSNVEVAKVREDG